MVEDSCPLCGSTKNKNSWLTLEFSDRVFAYLECDVCGSLFCAPMPHPEIIARMYGDDYMLDPDVQPGDLTLDKFAEVLEFAETLPPGNFLDYGCGDGRLLVRLKEMGWQVQGVDYNPDFAGPLAELGIKVSGPDETTDIQADVLHLGDVLEHLTDLDNDFPRILTLLKPGGYCVAHGPLEGNKNLFYRALRIGKRLRPGPTSMPPFHVTLSTTAGQRKLFERNGLTEVVFSEKEIAFPAPDQLKASDLGNARKLALFSLRKLSQAATTAGLGSGNRYFYVGRKLATG